jgi:hypothetical protein
MSPVTLLTCPVCGARLAYRDQSGVTAERMREDAKTHLQTHRLSESKLGIFKHKVASGSEVRDALPAAFEDAGLDRWATPNGR